MIPKFGGRDCELSTTGMDARGETEDSCTVTREVLMQIESAFSERGGSVWSRAAHSNYHLSPYSFDSLRHWSSGGSCFYGDLGPLEVCTASCLRPDSFAAQCLSVVLAAESARQRAQEAAKSGVVYSLSTSNADLTDPAISFGTHLSMSITPALWEDLFVEHQHPAVLGFVASAIAAAIPFFGVGYLIPLRDGSTLYSLSGRAHHLSKMSSLSTIEAFHRGLLNSRRESHGKEMERLHLIGFDFCLLSSALLFSFMQCVLAAAEEGYCRLNLFDPVRSMRIWSWSLDMRRGTLPATALLVDGRKLTLPQYMTELVQTLLEMCDSGLITPQVAPQAKQWLPQIADLARYAAEGSLVRCSRHLTWAAKLLWLTRICSEDGQVLGDAVTRLADHDFTNTDPQRGSMWRLWEEGLVDPFVSLADAEACFHAGPSESRDWGRGRIIDRFRSSIRDMDWSFVDLDRGGDSWSPRLRIELPHLDSLNQRWAERIEMAADPEDLARLLEQHGYGRAGSSDPIENITRQLMMVSN
jgi:hypothetical protein